MLRPEAMSEGNLTLEGSSIHFSATMLRSISMNHFIVPREVTDLEE